MCVTALSRVDDEETPQSAPRGARMALKDYSGNEAIRSREDGLVSTSPPPFSDLQTCASQDSLQLFNKLIVIFLSHIGM